MRRALVIVLDSVGVGAAPDADSFGDIGANTILHIAQACADGLCEQGRNGLLHLPNLQTLGLVPCCQLACNQTIPLRESIVPKDAAFGCAKEISTGKDTTSGHWEMMGAPVLFNWGYFSNPTDSFPADFIVRLIEQAKLPGILGNCIASGTEIIERFGEQHRLSGKPICYTSADSVFQIAYHESVLSPAKADAVCQIARELLNEYNIARVIARPFSGQNANDFRRTANRKDYSVAPTQTTFLDQLLEHQGRVISVGKIADIFANKGISQKIKANGLEQLMDSTIEAWQSCRDKDLVFTNIVDFDTLYGHRRDVNGYALALEQFDLRLGELLTHVKDSDLVILTADHGCDPTFPGSDHTREFVPLLSKGAFQSGSIGIRETFADIGQSLAEYFDMPPMSNGKSFINHTQ
ncbi:phosphopentomutase [Aliiglaciecola litoralis]|uniref:phosphopentomutase n=1 Tax=Aliiglaciecola litoralis TaxID=582857 RepID=UPI0031D81BA6